MKRERKALGRHHKAIAAFSPDSHIDVDSPRCIQPMLAASARGARNGDAVLIAENGQTRRPSMGTVDPAQRQKGQSEMSCCVAGPDIRMVNDDVPAMLRKSGIEADVAQNRVMRFGNEKTDFGEFVITYYISRVFSTTNFSKYPF